MPNFGNMIAHISVHRAITGTKFGTLVGTDNTQLVTKWCIFSLPNVYKIAF